MTAEPKDDGIIVSKNKLLIAIVAAVALGFVLGILYPITVAAL
jgi:hypothetical protein